MSGASYADYEKSYKEVKHDSVIPSSALAGVSAVGLREASPGAEPGELQERIDRTRETSDLMWRMNNYRRLPVRTAEPI